MAKPGMRDVSHKSSSLREARASATLRVSPVTMELIRSGQCPKGDPMPVARVAAIQAAKATATLIPYCHPVPIDYVGVEFELVGDTIVTTVEVRAVYKTGVEMEAITAASVAALNLFDLLKPVDDSMEILSVKLLEKTGGKSQFPLDKAFGAAVIVVSDSVAAGTNQDESGALLSQLLVQEGGQVGEIIIVPDDPARIRAAVEGCAGQGLIMLTGGTGTGPRDVTPEAVEPLLTRRLPGVEHRIQAFSQERFPTAMLGRPFAGLIGESLVIGLPGSPSAVRDAIHALFPYLRHAFPIMRGGGHGR